MTPATARFRAAYEFSGGPDVTRIETPSTSSSHRIESVDPSSPTTSSKWITPETLGEQAYHQLLEVHAAVPDRHDDADAQIRTFVGHVPSSGFKLVAFVSATQVGFRGRIDRFLQPGASSPPTTVAHRLVERPLTGPKTNFVTCWHIQRLPRRRAYLRLSGHSPLSCSTGVPDLLSTIAADPLKPTPVPVSSPTVTIGIPTYNRAELLREAIQSARHSRSRTTGC